MVKDRLLIICSNEQVIDRFSTHCARKFRFVPDSCQSFACASEKLWDCIYDAVLIYGNIEDASQSTIVEFAKQANGETHIIVATNCTEMHSILIKDGAKSVVGLMGATEELDKVMEEILSPDRLLKEAHEQAQVSR